MEKGTSLVNVEKKVSHVDISFCQNADPGKYVLMVEVKLSNQDVMAGIDTNGGMAQLIVDFMRSHIGNILFTDIFYAIVTNGRFWRFIRIVWTVDEAQRKFSYSECIDIGARSIYVSQVGTREGKRGRVPKMDRLSSGAKECLVFLQEIARRLRID